MHSLLLGPYRAIFNRMSIVIRDCTGLVLLFPLTLIDRCDYLVLDTQSKSPPMDIDADDKINILS